MTGDCPECEIQEYLIDFFSASIWNMLSHGYLACSKKRSFSRYLRRLCFSNVDFFRVQKPISNLPSGVHVRTVGQGCDSRARGNHARGLKNSLHVVFTRYLRGNHVRYIYGNILKNTVNTGESVFFLVVGGRGGWCLQVSCVVRLPFSLFSLSLFALFPPALSVRLQLQCPSPWTMVVRISLCHSSFLAT